ncbi:PepSY domain-containing protein [Ferrimonas sediminicola]|uniref:PepSY domain-containing protein n=1 Tax=Ferrimonas sediminicola TaxID=2569538 RepID=A0A4U1BHB6_9GAMM|nr:PepSY domain-containing protein [Ferrimonas sediminicola]TKB49411.1 PepSY domain-containing protein [Ferrimonas sediminicola]
MKTRTLTRWHSRIGILVCAWILLLACTGLLLQHGHRLGLDKPLLTGDLWYRLADLPKPRVTGVPRHEVFQVDNRLVTRQGSLAALDGDLQGLVVGPETMLVSDQGQLWLLTPEGELVDSTPLNGRRLAGISPLGEPVLQLGQHRWLQDWWLEGEAVSSDAKVAEPPQRFVETVMPDDLRDGHSGVSIERLLLWLHSGRIFGALGEWLMSAVALMAIGIACTGFVIWGRRR